MALLLLDWPLLSLEIDQITWSEVHVGDVSAGTRMPRNSVSLVLVHHRGHSTSRVAIFGTSRHVVRSGR